MLVIVANGDLLFEAFEVVLVVAGQFPVAEAATAGIGENGPGRGFGFAVCRRRRGFDGQETLLGQRFEAVALLLGGAFGGGVKNLEVAVGAVDFGGGGFDFLDADQLHVGVGGAVEFEQDFGAAADGGVGGRFQRSFSDFGYAICDGLDDGPEAFGDAFVGAGGGG